MALLLAFEPPRPRLTHACWHLLDGPFYTCTPLRYGMLDPSETVSLQYLLRRILKELLYSEASLNTSESQPTPYYSKLPILLRYP